MELLLYATENIAGTLKKLETTDSGLSSKAALERLKLYGPNKISLPHFYWWRILFRQLKSPFIYLLIVAALLSFGLKDTTNGLMVLLFVFIGATLGFYQEYKSEKILKSLKRYITSLSKVLRNGKQTVIKSAQLVPGDIIYLETGDTVPADVRVLEEENLTVDESILTGESVSVKKTNETLKKDIKSFYKAKNLCFSGTVVAGGKCTGIVLATGKETAFGKIAGLSAKSRRESEFEKAITKFSSFILRLIIITLAIVFIINILFKNQLTNIPQLLIFSIALAVSVIPEALPVVMTFSMSRGALKLAKNNVVVKRLSAIEDLGSIEILCADKTGTLTENELAVSDIYAKETRKEALMFSGIKTVDFYKAISKFLPAEDMGILNNVEILKDTPFNPERKRSSLLIKKGQLNILYVRGAYEEIIKLCPSMSVDEKKKVRIWAMTQGSKGSRVVAVAKRNISDESANLFSVEKALDFVGAVAFFDPIKKTTINTIKKAQKLGVTIKILTGDSKEVAFAVANKIGLAESTSKVITGERFEKLASLEKAKEVMRRSVFARVSPEQKVEIINLLREKAVVGFLGEGINDAPAIKTADVGLVVKGAANVSSEAADIVLLKKDLSVIVGGIKNGRETFANTAKYIKATLASNFGNFYAVAVISLFVDFLPLLPLQILLLNLLSDFPMIGVATDSVDSEELKSPKKYDVRGIALISTILGVVSSFFDFAFFFVFYKISPEVLRTNWFMGSVLTELLFLFSIRTKKVFFKAKRPSNLILALTAIAILITVTLPFTTLGRDLFGFKSPKFEYLMLTTGITLTYLIATETTKVLYYRTLASKRK